MRPEEYMTPAQTENCKKRIADKILRERREKIATEVLAGFLSNSNTKCLQTGIEVMGIGMSFEDASIHIANRLIEKLDAYE